MEHLNGPSFLRTIFLILISLSFLPLSISIVIFSYATQILITQPRIRGKLRRSPRFRSKTILISGIGTPQGLRIARAFYETGHTIVGADFESDGLLLYARYSKALRSFYPLRPHNEHYGSALYTRDLLAAAQKEDAELYINCSPSIPPAEYYEVSRALRQKTDCKTLALDDDLTDAFSTRDKSLSYVKSLGLPVVELYHVHSRADVHRILHESQGKKTYILNAANGAVTCNTRKMLPRRTLSQTYNDLSNLRITKDAPWILEQCFVAGEEYTTFAVVVRGELKAFAAAKASKVDTSYQNVRADAGIGRAMLRFVQSFIQLSGSDFTTNLSMSFRIEERSTVSGLEWNILPIDCKATVAPPVLLFSGATGAMALARAYMTILTPSINGISTFTGMGAVDDSTAHVITPSPLPGAYFVGQDLLDLVINPLLEVLTLKLGILQLLKNWITFVEHLLFWRDGIYEVWDPLPVFLLYHVQMPGRLLRNLLRRSRSGTIDIDCTGLEAIQHVNEEPTM